MGLFRVNQPRGFQHNYIYYDPRKESGRKPVSSGILIIIIIVLLLVAKFIYTGKLF